MLKNTASQKIGAQLVNVSDGTAFTGSVTIYVTGDAGTQGVGSVGAGACTHEGNGYHTYAPAQAETNYDLIAFTFTGTGAVPVSVQVETQASTVIASINTKIDTIDDFLDTEIAAILAAVDTEVAAIKAKTDNLPEGISKNVAFTNFEFYMVASTDHVTPKTGLTVTCERSIDGGAFAAMANSATEVSAGIYKINLAQADTNGDFITYKFTSTGADPTLVSFKTEAA